MWRKNRFLSLSLAGIGMVFWLCLRDLSERFAAYPFLSVLYDARFQLAAFLAVGFALAWAFHAWNPKSKWRARLGPLAAGAAYVLFQKLYNLAFGRRGEALYYVVNPWLQLVGLCAGAAAFALFARREAEAAAPEPEIPLTDISAHRSQLMGIGIMAVIAVHTITMDMRYVVPLEIFVMTGNIGADIFLFVSGIGMVRSLSRDPSAWNFYKRRIRRIYPEAMPWMAAYGVVCLLIGKYNLPDVILTSLGIDFLVKGSGFNWYISFILLFYLLTPLLYRLLRRRETRWAWASLLVCMGLLSVFLLNDVLHKTSLLIGFSRFPIFVVGLVAGFWLKEGRGLTRSEYRSMVCLAIPVQLTAYLLSKMELQPVLGSMWLCYCIVAPVACLALSRAFSRAGGGGRFLRFLEWSGKNSLLIYIWNILLVWFYLMFSAKYLKGAGILPRAIYTAVTVFANYWIVYLIQKAKAALRRRAA